MTGYYTSADVDRLDVEPSYRPNWRDRARWAREKEALNPPDAPVSDTGDEEAPGQGEGVHEAGDGL